MVHVEDNTARLSKSHNTTQIQLRDPAIMLVHDNGEQCTLVRLSE